jgi:hypothetical protein
MFAGRPGRLVDYINLPPLIGMIVSSGHATLIELQSVYGVRDAFNLCEVIAIDAHNRREADRQT